MENMNPALERKETFQRELNSLHQKLDEKLTQLEVSGRIASAPDIANAEINGLKIHRMKVRTAWEWVQNASEEDWNYNKSVLQSNFEEAAKLI